MVEGSATGAWKHGGNSEKSNKPVVFFWGGGVGEGAEGGKLLFNSLCALFFSCMQASVCEWRGRVGPECVYVSWVFEVMPF